MMMRLVGIPSLVLLSLAATAEAQTIAPSATPTNGAVGSAALSNGYPGSGGAFTLPAIANSNTAATPLAGTTTFSTTSTSTSDDLDRLGQLVWHQQHNDWQCRQVRTFTRGRRGQYRRRRDSDGIDRKRAPLGLVSAERRARN